MRIGGFLLGLLALGFVASAGKPGGGGSAPGGVIYFWGGSIKPDGSGEQSVTGAVGQPTYSLHDGHRWFLSSVADTSTSNPDGTPSTRIDAVRGDGTTVTLVPSAADWKVSGAETWLVWGKDDSFLSYTGVAWYGSGALDANSCIFRAEIEWDAAGEPSVVGDPAIVVELEELMDESVARSVIHQCDWEPGGGRLVYHYGPPGTQEIRLFTVSSGSDTFLATGHDPWWAPDGTLIAYARAPTGDSGVWTVDPDASGSDTLLLADGGKYRYHTPRWSPDSAHLCFSKVSKSSVSIARVAVTGGAQTTVAAGQPLAWR